MKNPLNKRLLRDLKDEWSKYLVIFVLLVLMIGEVSGFLIADGSIQKTYYENFDLLNVEDGHFTTKKEMNRAQYKEVSNLGITLYDMHYYDDSFDNDTTIRIYASRTEVNKVDVLSGELPDKLNEIAIDRMYAVNNDLDVGDTISDGKNKYKITGLVALVDYSSLFQSNTDSMFNAQDFGVAVVSQETFATFNKDFLTYNYSWIYDNKPEDEKEEADVAEDLMNDISENVALDDFVPNYANQAIHFTGEDFGSDYAMYVVLLYILMVIIAFVFAVTTSNTIAKESTVIGTLRASGYTQKELVMHYLTMPTLVTFLGALIGNILGYTVFMNFNKSLYYGSYSLATYKLQINATAFIITTVIPVIITMAINYLILSSKLKLSPLKFLRKDLKKKVQKRAFHLPEKLGFFTRFRIRVIFQNASNYIVLFFGIFFANFLLFFGLAFPSLLNDYKANLEDTLFAKYQYILAVPQEMMSDNGSKLDQLIAGMVYMNAVETDNADAEKFTAYSLITDDEYEEEVTLYGIKDNSRYLDLDVSKDQVYISKAYHEKYLVDVGDTITLDEKYDDDQYEFTITGIYDYQGSISIYTSQDNLNDILDLDDSYFSGYFSDSEITDIDEEYIGNVIDINEVTKMSRQLTDSMGSIMYMVEVIAIVIFVVLIFLLSKQIIEKNAQSISMTKILGYNNNEISQLYILSTTIVVIISVVITSPLSFAVFIPIYRPMMCEMMTGWLPLMVDPMIYVKMIAMGIVAYALVAYLEYHKVKKVPMDTALKNIE